MAAGDGKVKSANGMGIKIMVERVKPATESTDLINGTGIKVMEELSVWYIW